MNIFSFLKSSGNKDSQSNSYSQEINRCLVDCKLTKEEYKVLSIYYYQGHTSYRSFYKYVFLNNITKIRKIMKQVSEKSKDSCNIDFTFVRFKYNNTTYIDIPFDVFSEKKNMRMNRRNLKLWNKANIKRIILHNPSIRNLDDAMVNESLTDLLNNIIES